MSTADSFLDDVGRLFGPHEGRGVRVPLVDVALDVPNEGVDRLEGAAAHRRRLREVLIKEVSANPNPCGGFADRLPEQRRDPAALLALPQRDGHRAAILLDLSLPLPILPFRV